MRRCLDEQVAPAEVSFFNCAADLVEWLHDHLPTLTLICLDHDLEPYRNAVGELVDAGKGREVADYLAGQDPMCPVIVHSSNGNAAFGMQFALEEAGWDARRVIPFGDLDWIGEVWIEDVCEAIKKLGD